MTVTIDKEKFSPTLYEELFPLAQKCWDERTIEKGETCAFNGDRDREIDPDLDKYQGLADAGSMVFLTVRDKGALRGYVMGIVHHSMHMKKVLCGFVDCIYLDPEYRAYTGPLASKFEKEMVALGCEIIGWPVHINGPVYEVAHAMGYVGDDIVMEKRLKPCVSPLP